MAVRQRGPRPVQVGARKRVQAGAVRLRMRAAAGGGLGRAVRVGPVQHDRQRVRVVRRRVLLLVRRRRPDASGQPRDQRRRVHLERFRQPPKQPAILVRRAQLPVVHRVSRGGGARRSRGAAEDGVMIPATVPDVRQDVLDYLVRMRFNDYEGELDFDTHLLEVGILDSLSMMTVVLFLEQKYGLDFFTIDITRDDFYSIDVLARMLVRSINGTDTP